MSRNFALLKIVGKEEEYFPAGGGHPASKLAGVYPPVEEARPFPGDGLDRRQLDESSCFELEAWQREELNRLVQGVFLARGGESKRSPSKRVVVLASSESGNGCTWICARAGELLAGQTSGRVCLIDANPLRPALHQHFGVSNHYGLAELVRKQGAIGGYVSQLSRRNLALVSAGNQFSGVLSPHPAKPNLLEQNSDHGAETVLAAERLRARLQELGTEFSYILIDGPSLDASDASIALAGMADGIVLVFRTHSTRKERTRSRLQALKSSGARILGAVLNQPAC